MYILDTLEAVLHGITDMMLISKNKGNVFIYAIEPMVSLTLSYTTILQYSAHDPHTHKQLHALPVRLLPDNLVTPLTQLRLVLPREAPAARTLGQRRRMHHDARAVEEARWAGGCEKRGLGPRV